MIIVRIIASIAGFVAVAIIIISGLRLITGGGDTSEVAGARRSIIYALVGIVVILVAQFIIGFVISSI